MDQHNHQTQTDDYNCGIFCLKVSLEQTLRSIPCKLLDGSQIEANLLGESPVLRGYLLYRTTVGADHVLNFLYMIDWNLLYRAKKMNMLKAMHLPTFDVHQRNLNQYSSHPNEALGAIAL